MRLILLSLTLILAGPAHAHLGHVGELAGHSHWIGLGALGIAIGIGIWLGKGQKEDEPEEQDAEEEQTA